MTISDLNSIISTGLALATAVILGLFVIYGRKLSRKFFISASVILALLVVSYLGLLAYVSHTAVVSINGKTRISSLVNPSPTDTPTSISSPTPTPKVISENLNIPCLSCQGGNYALTLKINTITIDYAIQQTIMKYTLTNIGTVSCNVIFNKLEFQDDNGTIFKAQNVGQSIVDIAVGNPFIAKSTFDLLPRPNTHYLLSTSIDCTNRIDFKTQDFVFN